MGTLWKTDINLRNKYIHGTHRFFKKHLKLLLQNKSHK